MRKLLILLACLGPSPASAAPCVADAFRVTPTSAERLVTDTLTVTGAYTTSCGHAITTGSVTWISRNPSVATFGTPTSRTALVTAVGVGSTYIVGSIADLSDSMLMIVGTVVTPPTPPVTTVGGAVVTIGAVLPPCSGTTLTTSSDVAAVVAAAAGNTTFCFQAGTYVKARNIVPKTGDRFYGTGNFGDVVLNGADTAHHAFQTVNSSAANVTIKYLAIRNYSPPTQNGAIQGDNGRGWIIDSNEVSYSHQVGIRVGKTFHVGWNSVHHNATVGLGGWKTEDTVMVIGNVFDHNPPAFVSAPGITAEASQIKLFGAVGTSIRENLFTDGPNKGVWFDTDNYNDTIIGNVFLRHGQAAIWQEAGFGIIVRRNIIQTCGTAGSPAFLENAGIQVTNSYPVTIDSNTISGCDQGIAGMAVAATSGNYFTDFYSEDGNQGRKALGIHVAHNNITQDHGHAGGVRSTGTGADTAFTWAGRSTWTANQYNLTGNTTGPFTWLNADKTAAQWQALGFDVGGSFTP